MSEPTAAEPRPPYGLRRLVAGLLVLALVAAIVGATILVRNRLAPTTKVSSGEAAKQATLQLVPEPGRTGAATCTDPVTQREWRVAWKAVAAAGPPVPPAAATTARATTVPPATDPSSTTEPSPTGSSPAPAPTARPGSPALANELATRAGAVRLIPTGFAVRKPGGAWQSQDSWPWLLRWSPTIEEAVAAATTPSEQWQREGSLPSLAKISMTVRQDPRFVTPDGACTVYLAPFVAGTAGSNNAVAVVGDSLVAQLYAPEDGTLNGTGYLLNRLAAAGSRAEIAGQGGRRWTRLPDPGSALTMANTTMLDELRGLREARSVVVALGTNDAGWVARARSQEQFDLRLAWVQLRLGELLDELHDQGHCTVLATMATRDKELTHSSPTRFATAASTINDLLRQRATHDPNDRLKLADWALRADAHSPSSPQPWFGSDTIHLNQAGHGPYADELATAARLC